MCVTMVTTDKMDVIKSRVVARKINISNRCRVWGFPQRGSWQAWQHPHVIEDGPTDGGPSQLIAYRLVRCWLLP